MSVTGDKLPSPSVLLGVIDTEARATAVRAQQELAPIVAREVPRGRTGKTAGALRPKVSRTATGAALTISAPRGKVHTGQATIADVVRWVNRGTGLHRKGAGRKAPIRSSKPGGQLVLPGGKRVRFVRGQHPNAFMDRIRTTGTLRVERTFARGAAVAARAVERKM